MFSPRTDFKPILLKEYVNNTLLLSDPIPKYILQNIFPNIMFSTIKHGNISFRVTG